MTDKRDALVHLLGWRALLLQSDPLTYSRWRWVKRRLARGTSVRTLDAGSGNGAFSIAAASSGTTVVGLSYLEHEVTRANGRATYLRVPARFEQADLRELDALSLRDGPFDQILCLEVIEHIKDDQLLLRRLAQRLAPGGRILLTTPTDAHAPLLGEIDNHTDNEDGRHVRWGYSVATLREITEDAGLEPVEIRPIGGIVAQGLTNALHRGGARHQRLAWALTLPLRLALPADDLLTRLLRGSWHSYALVALRRGT